MKSFYNFANYITSRTNDENGEYQLKPLTQDDMCTYSAEDVADWYAKHGVNSSKLGEPMTDEELYKFYGQL